LERVVKRPRGQRSQDAIGQRQPVHVDLGERRPARDRCPDLVARRVRPVDVLDRYALALPQRLVDRAPFDLDGHDPDRKDHEDDGGLQPRLRQRVPGQAALRSSRNRGQGRPRGVRVALPVDAAGENRVLHDAEDVVVDPDAGHDHTRRHVQRQGARHTGQDCQQGRGAHDGQRAAPRPDRLPLLCARRRALGTSARVHTYWLTTLHVGVLYHKAGPPVKWGYHAIATYVGIRAALYNEQTIHE
ncbi:hypothetical protein PBRA_001688, partial [Plasmodiophora brassicae]